MSTAHHVAHLLLSVLMIVGGYASYFWCQRNPLFEPRELGTRLDDLVPYAPRWVWVYGLMYVPVVLCVNLVLDSPEQFAQVASSYVLLSVLQFACFLVLPVRTPQSWRVAHAGTGLSERLLAFMQRLDAPSNSFPSMHTSVAMLTALHLQASHGAAAFAFPVLIGLSCLFTKQHYVVDVAAGAAMGWLAHGLWWRLVMP